MNELPAATENSKGIRAILTRSGPYAFLQSVLGGDSARRTLIDENLRPAPGDRFLDLGCGPGTLVPLLPDVRYTGLDLNSRYVETARKRFGDRGRFYSADVRDTSAFPAGPYDIAACVFLLHHLDDETVDELARAVRGLLASDGRLVTVDPTFVEGQSPVARWVIEHDRGRSVREPEGYRSLLAAHFDTVDVTVRQDLLRIPYSHAIVEARSPL
jgi:SAM-dependent methyltransferase